jgi:hypothetical protein
MAHFCMACNAPRLKTFLEKLLKFSNADPFEKILHMGTLRDNDLATL